METRMRSLSKRMKHDWDRFQGRLRVWRARGVISASQRDVMRRDALSDLLKVQAGEMGWDEWKTKHTVFRPTGRPRKEIE